MASDSQRVHGGGGAATLPAAPVSDGWLARILLDQRILTASQLSELERDASPSLWASAVRKTWTSDGQLTQAVASAFRVRVADLERADPRFTTLVPETLARRHLVIPLVADDRVITVAVADPRNLDLEQTLRFVTGRNIAFEVAAPDAIRAKLDELYRPERSIERLLNGLEPASVQAVDESPPSSSADPALDAPVAKLVDAMVSDAVREGASDVHAEPGHGAVVVRYRVDGVLREVMRLPEAAGAAVVRRVKIWARLDVTDPLKPHDGRASARVDGHTVDLRVSTIPVARRGEKVVIRILDKTNVRTRLDALQLAPDELALISRLMNGHREGMVLVTGPTGSGKTTTLYAALNELRTGKVNIVTVEDPVEYDVPGISQIQVNEAQGLTFPKALRSVLRQDPDIVLVGEIRDLETATVAVQAGFSGHLVLSTLHTNDAASAVVRLRDLGVEQFKLAAVLKGVVAQRLVRRLCDACAQPVDPASLPVEAQPPASRSEPVQPRQAVGCRACNGRGYRGRIAVVEILPVDETVARLIDAGAPPESLVSVARRLGMRTLWESGLQRVWSGTTSLDELVRVLGERASDDASPDAAALLAAPSTAVIAPLTAPHADGRAASEAGGPDALAAPPASAASGTAGQRLLIADDDPQMRRLIRSVLEREGFEVVEAEDGLDALDLVMRHKVDLVVLDYDMPRLDGLGVLEELRAQIATASLPVIVLTARHGEVEEKALDLGAQDFLTKPVQTRSLVARVKAVLRRASV